VLLSLALKCLPSQGGDVVVQEGTLVVHVTTTVVEDMNAVEGMMIAVEGMMIAVEGMMIAVEGMMIAEEDTMTAVEDMMTAVEGMMIVVGKYFSIVAFEHFCLSHAIYCYSVVAFPQHVHHDSNICCSRFVVPYVFLCRRYDERDSYRRNDDYRYY
jgi:hypothetical protein